MEDTQGLNDEELRAIGKDAFGIDPTFDGNLLKFARAVIAAHESKKVSHNGGSGASVSDEPYW